MVNDNICRLYKQTFDTTGEACVRNNRKFIGIEKNDKFFEMSCNRIRKIVLETENSLWN